MTVAAAGLASTKSTINAICDNRMAFLRSLSTFDTFGKGWTSRVSGVRAMALGMANTFAPPPVEEYDDAQGHEPKDPIPDAPKVDVTTGHNIATIVLGALGALIAAAAAFIGFGR